MKQDIILAGVGGQGILSIATIIGEAATSAGVNLKQAEVHGMSQRGGDVQSNLRLSNEPIWSDLIPTGQADMILAMEPMEALRYVPFLSRTGWIVTSSASFVNIPNYPHRQELLKELDSYPNVLKLDIEDIAAKAGSPKSANMVLLGMAAPLLKILSPEELRLAVARVFASKGDAVVENNLKAFDAGMEAKR
ncbi:MAG: indolepyruvate oxidoreductase subunit beta [Bacteroidales bacterium]|nr:indolepyruvate oxidoreductase subunit beta [Candidatus Cacconaster equi]